MVVLLLFSDFVNGMQRILFQDSMGTSSVDVPQRHVPRCLQQACSSTHKAWLAMVVFWIWQWWRFGVSSKARLGGIEVWRR
jgi:hypothetical protein